MLRRAVWPLPLVLAGCITSVPDGPDATIAPGDATLPPPSNDAPNSPDAAGIPDVHRGEPPPPSTVDFCGLAGSVVWSGGQMQMVGSAPAGSPDLSWLHVPDGFCVHYFGNVPETRQLRFSPSGDLFVASPSQSASGGASGGLGAIVVLPDDNGDGVADRTLTFLGGGDAAPGGGTLTVTQGMLFYDGNFYYQNGTAILKTPWTAGMRATADPGTQVVDVDVYTSPVHWSKVLDVDDNGNIFVTNGGDEGEVCESGGTGEGTLPASQRPFHGGILRIDGSPHGELFTRGLRNAYSIRCARGTGMCFGLELARDFAAEYGSREKLFPIRKDDDWGFPCCATAGLAYSDYTDPTPDCSTVAAEEDSFLIDHTPFGLDFEEGAWSGTWQYRAFVALHGYFGSWVGARIVGIATDARTGWPVNVSEASPGTAMADFATGWDDGKNDHGRPAAITFAPDGRLFVGNDITGDIVWVAPVTK